MAKSKKQMILEFLKDHPQSGITSLEAINRFGVTRLAAIIFNLKKDGHNINTEMVTRKDRFNQDCTVAKYTLIPKGKLFG